MRVAVGWRGCGAGSGGLRGRGGRHGQEKGVTRGARQRGVAEAGAGGSHPRDVEQESGRRMGSGSSRGRGGPRGRGGWRGGGRAWCIGEGGADAGGRCWEERPWWSACTRLGLERESIVHRGSRWAIIKMPLKNASYVRVSLQGKTH